MTTRAVEAWTLEPLVTFVKEAGARLVLVMTSAGQVMAQHGFSRAVDVMSAAALGAAIIASTDEIARQLAQPPFAVLNHQGERHGIFLGAVPTGRGKLVVLVVYDLHVSSLGLVQLFFEEITCKIVYYGPGRSGKTTNLHYIYGRVPDSRRGRMVSLATQTDRTLFFDFLPIDLGQISGFNTRFQLYTVPGQVYYNATRRLVLQGADGVVFVADSQARQLDENLESLQNLQSNLLEHGVDIRTMPLVLQYNKQDLPRELILSTADLDDALNFRGVASFSADALHGVGVFETLKGVSEMVLKRLAAGSTA